MGILNAVKTLPETSRVGLITFASAISVYELGLPEVASAEVFPGTSLPRGFVFLSLLLVSCVRNSSHRSSHGRGRPVSAQRRGLALE